MCVRAPPWPALVGMDATTAAHFTRAAQTLVRENDGRRALWELLAWVEECQ